MKKSRLISIILSLILIISLTACNNDNTTRISGEPAMNYFDANGADGNNAVIDAPAQQAGEAQAHRGAVAAGVPRGGGNDSEFPSEINPHLHSFDYSREQYGTAEESPFQSVLTNPLSTFAANPNTASYSNMRRMINQGLVPPAQSVRIEEFINYFSYDYPAPNRRSEHPFSINAEVAVCPWNTDNLIAKIAVQGEAVQGQRLRNNVVFLIDVSGSMNQPDRLPLVKESFLMLLDKIDEGDIISIVTYAGDNATLVEGVPGNQKQLLTNAVNSLTAAGSTGGSGGITKAYELAHANFIQGGNNRIILATDGDFNVGVTSTHGLVELVREHKGRGVSLSVLGYGMFNLNDTMMEEIAKAGNGNYAYIDTIEEAKKYLVDEFDSMMYTIAKDLKIQVEFNPAVVAEYRLIGYDNRRLNNEDFNDDTVDGGDIGAGFSVSALYELVLTDSGNHSTIDPLIYQTSEFTGSSDYMNVKVRYKRPDDDVSRLVQKTISADYLTSRPSDNFLWASAVAQFGLILRQSQFAGNANTDSVIELARSCSPDEYGLRREFIRLVQEFRILSR
jgi:Ca-activated chloride channel family protein